MHQREKFKRIKTDSRERIESKTKDFSQNVNTNKIGRKETKIEKEIHKNYTTDASNMGIGAVLGQIIKILNTRYISQEGH